MHIVVDEEVWGAERLFAPLGTLECLPATELSSPSRVRHADILIVRSVTRVVDRLLQGANVQWIGSATAGVDHVDVHALARRGVRFAYAPGCNADAVSEYVLSALLSLEIGRAGATIGVIGFGQVGRRLTRMLRALGYEVLVCDPPLQRSDPSSRAGGFASEPELAAMARSENFVALDAIMKRCNVLTLHVPLTAEGPYPTFRMVNAALLSVARPGTTIINTSRGEVIHAEALHPWLAGGRGRAVLDVWDGEPKPDLRLVGTATLATAHIAGATHEAKERAATMLRDALARELGAPLDSSDSSGSRLVGQVAWDAAEGLRALVCEICPVRRYDSELRALTRLGHDAWTSAFAALRRPNRWRHEFGAHEVVGAPSSFEEPLRRCGFRVALDDVAR
jgi:erythronate-4-phosphate dehydrogenase